MNTYFTESIILKHKDFREADRILNIYSKNYGKLDVIARGSRKIKSKLAGSLEPFCLVNLNLAKGKSFDTVISSEIIINYNGIKSNLLKYAIANYCAEIIDNLTKPYHRDLKIYKWLNDFFQILDRLSKIENNKSSLVWFFIWNFLSLLGYQPNLYKCAYCKKEIGPKGNLFSFPYGGVACGSCDKGDNEIVISEDVIKVLRIILRNDYKKLLLIKISQHLAKEISKITDLFLKYHLERDLNSRKFLAII